MAAAIEKQMLAARTGSDLSLAGSGLGSVSKVEKKEKELGVESEFWEGAIARGSEAVVFDGVWD